jgi:hypothetical protein
MPKRSNPYEARSEEERQRNQTRLGNQWQEQPLTPEEQRWQNKMAFWRAGDVSSIQPVPWMLFGVAVLVLVLLLTWLV